MKPLATSAAALISLIALGCAPPLNGEPLQPGHPRPEDTYTITSVLQILPPFNVADMNDDFQDARELWQGKDSALVEITYYPLYQPVVGENPDWRKDDAGMTEYLKPTATENWDEAMRRDLLAELRQDGIEPDQLTDRQLVEKVSAWAMKRAHSTHAFSIWCDYFPKGSAEVYPPLRAAFDQQKPDQTWTDQQMFEAEALGRSMFYNREHGACTSSSIYLATILRALGIPTRMVFCIPPFDPNDAAQTQMFYDNVHHNQVRETVRASLDGMQGFANHFFNEVFVGRHWIWLNYSRLGQPVLDAHYFGLLTHIETSTDLSQVPLAQTWGMRYFQYPANQPKLSSINPYRLLAVQDGFGTNAHVENPAVPVAGLRTVTINGLYQTNSPAVPKWVDREMLAQSKTDFLIAGKEWIRNAPSQMRVFAQHASQSFLLVSPGNPEVRVKFNGLKLSSGDGSFQAYGAQILSEDRPRLMPGAGYTIRPQNTNETYRWLVETNIAPLTFNQ